MKQEKLHQPKRRGIKESTLSEKLFKLFIKQNKYCQFKSTYGRGGGQLRRVVEPRVCFLRASCGRALSLFQDKQRKTMWEHGEKTIVHKQLRQVLPEVNPVGTLISDFSASRTIFHFFLMLFSGIQYDKMHMTGVFIDSYYSGRAFEIEGRCSFTLKTQISSPLGIIRYLHWRPRMETTGPRVLYIL